MGKEFELKDQASPEDLEKILKEYGDFHEISMETHYYDTPDGALGKLRWTPAPENGKPEICLRPQNPGP